MNTKPIIVFSILILLSGITLVNGSKDAYFSPYVEIIPHLLSIEKESLANLTNPESPIYDSGVVKVYGDVPKIETKSQLLEHVSTLRRIRDNSTHEMIPLLYPEGPVVQYGANTIRGYIVIELYDGDEHKTSYSESEFDEIYNILRKNAIKVGIDDYPVVFVLTNNTQLIGSLDVHAWYESDEHVFSLESVYTVESLIQDLADQNVSVKVNAVAALVDMGEPAVEPLIQALKDNNPKIHENAAQALGKIGDERAVAPLIELLADEQQEVRKSAEDALADIGEPAVGPLVKVMNDPDENYLSRESAIGALGKIGEPAVEPLIQALDNLDLELLAMAAHSLREIGEPAVDSLIQALEHDNPQVRARAAEALSGINDERIVEPLTKALNDEYELVRTFAKMGLERMENQQHTGVIATYGKEREFSIEDERREWFDKLDSIGSGVRGDMQVYLYPDGPVISYGYEYHGYLTVYFLEGSDVNESLMDEIYGIFDQQGIQMGINDIPVVFQFESLPVEDVLNEGGLATDEDVAVEGDSEPPETPGFTAITLLMAFLVLFLKK